jgi:CheY-like chemotaxis protein
MSGRPSALTLVVVDDDEQIRRAVGRFLRSHGHKVHVFDSAEAGRESISTRAHGRALPAPVPRQRRTLSDGSGKWILGRHAIQARPLNQRG